MLSVEAGAGPAIEGLWVVEGEEAHIRIEQCGRNLCAQIAWMKDLTDATGMPRTDVKNPDKNLKGRSILGLSLLKDVGVEPNRHGAWAGRIYDPQRGKYYRCTLRLAASGDLRVRGYIGIPLLGRTSRWRRIPLSERAAPHE